VLSQDALSLASAKEPLKTFVLKTFDHDASVMQQINVCNL
jgi:hypothetical protein